ncbi:purine-cytosine permease [Clavulina sp. PMI_390]|nr:purine-cytosine permease [Clavulina sp. PMI_390]
MSSEKRTTETPISPPSETPPLRRSSSGLSEADARTSKKYAAFGNIPLSHAPQGQSSRWDVLTDKLLGWSVESRGILPVPPEQRTDPQFWKVFFLWLSANLNILSFSAGTLGPIAFGLNLKDSFGVIVGFNVLGCLLPAYFATFGPKLGLRQMCQARYSFGFYWVTIPAFLNSTTMFGFMVLNCILGGQTLSSASIAMASDGTPAGGGMSWDVGIVVVGIVSLFISFCGFRVLNLYERVAWLPILIVYCIALGVSGKDLISSSPALPEHGSAQQILTFGASIAGFVISYCPLSSDFTSYFPPHVPGWKVFLSTFAGLFLPTVLVQLLGAAFATALLTNPAWTNAYNSAGLAGLFHIILLPAGPGFARFLLVVLAFSVTANVAPTLYSFSLSAQTTLPFDWIVRVPRFIFSFVCTAALVPISIVASTRFYSALNNFLGLISYWSACFGAVVTVEHLVFRRGSFANYRVEDWDRARRLPPGYAAILGAVTGIGIIVLCMDQVWFVGPIAKTTGDIGFEIGFAVSACTYAVLRGIEQRIAHR